MNKGNTGVFLWFYAMMAFVLAIFGQTLLCALLCGFVLIVEKDEWCSRQAIQAVLLCLVNLAVDRIFSASALSALPIPFLNSALGMIVGFINGIFSLVVFVFAILAILKVCKGQDASVPGLSGLAGRAFQAVQQYAPAQQYAQQQAPAQPTQGGWSNSNPGQDGQQPPPQQ